MGIADLFKQTAMNLPDKVAIEFEEQRVTFKEIDIYGNKFANALQAIGIAKGDRVAQFMPNSLELVYSLVGNFKNGSIAVPMNINFKENDIIEYCREHLASFKKPKFVEFLGALPKNTMGKILKEELRNMHKAK